MTSPQQFAGASALAAALATTAAGASAATFDFESVAPPAFTGTVVPDGYAASSGTIGFNAVFLPSIYSGPIDKIVFHVAGSNRFSFDDLQATAAVPEVHSAWLLLAGLTGLGGLLRRRLG